MNDRGVRCAFSLVWISGVLLACGGETFDQLPLSSEADPDVAAVCDGSGSEAALSFACGLRELPQWFQSNCSSQLSPINGCTAGGRAQSAADCQSFGFPGRPALGSWPTEGSGEMSSVLVRVDELRFGRPPDEIFERYAGYFAQAGCVSDGRRAALDGVTAESFLCSGWVGYTELRPETNTVSGFWAGAARSSARLCIEAP